MRRLILIPILIGIAVMIFMTNLNRVDERLYNEGQYTYRLDGQQNAIIVDFVPSERQTVLAIPSFLSTYPVTTIDERAIDGQGILEVYLPDTLLLVKENGVTNCESVVNLAINCLSKGENGFENMTHVKNLMVIAHRESSIMDDHPQNESLFYPSIDSIERLVISSGITKISDESFCDLTSLVELELGEDIEQIGKGAFANDRKIEKIVLPSKLVKVERDAFKNVNQSTIIINKNLEMIEESSFSKGSNYLIYQNQSIADELKGYGIENRMLELVVQVDDSNLQVGETTHLSVLDDFDEEIHYISTDPTVLLVDQNGKALALKEGTVKVEVFNSLVSKEVTLNVEKASQKTIVLKPLERIELQLENFSLETNDNYHFESSDDEVAIVSLANQLIGLTPGSATISLVVEQQTEEFTVMVLDVVEEVSFKEPSITLNKGSYVYVEAEVFPSNAYNQQLIYTIEDENIAKIDCNGKLTAVNEGHTILYASSTDDSQRQASMEVYVSSTTINIENAPVILMPKKNYRLRANTNDASKLSYLSLDESIAVVDENGMVTGVNEGTTDIIIYNNNQSTFKKIKCKVYDAISYGVDLSEWNGWTYTEEDFQRMKDFGIDFVYVRAAYEDDYQDYAFEPDYTLAKKVGLDVGAYHYITATTIEKARSEAEWMLTLLEGKQFEYPIMCDIETQKQKELSVYDWNQIVFTYCNILQEAGYDVIVYSYASQLNRLNYPYDVHVANWGVLAPSFNKEYTIWQFTSDGLVDGLKGRIDMNICFVDYPGIIKENHRNGY